MKTGKFALAMAAVASFGLATAGEGLAQACIGTPTVSGQRALSVGVGFPEAATNYNVGLHVNAMGPLSYQASYSHTAFDGTAGSMNTVGADVAYRLPSPVIAGNIPITGCPVAGVSYGMSSGNVDQTQLTVPVGFGLGTRVGVGAGMALVPYVTPQFVFSRTSTQLNNERVVSTRNGLGATVGAALDFGPFYAGVDVNTTRWNGTVPTTNSQAGLRVGVKF